jgi:glutathione S-transferase
MVVARRGDAERALSHNGACASFWSRVPEFSRFIDRQDTIMLKIYHIEARRSERVVWLMEELGLPYELLFAPGDIMASAAAIKAIHPIGAAPTIQDGDLKLCESGAILEYVIARHGGGRLGVRSDQAEYPAYVQWMHFAEGTAMDRILGEMALKPLLEGAPPNASPLAVLYVGRSRQLLEFFELSLQDRPYFAGETFTAADIMMHLPVKVTALRQVAEAFPKVGAWLKRVEGRDAFNRMLARALPNGAPARPSAQKPKDGPVVAALGPSTC